ncbi:MAG: hypothetical protein JSU92_02955, partial [Deltaproteobacteria bacterium]
MLKKVGRLLRSRRGAALIVAMLLLIILTVLGLAAIQTSKTEIEIAGNERRSRCALYASDAGLQYALERVCGLNYEAIPVTDIGNDVFFWSNGPVTTVGSIRVPGGFDFTLQGYQVIGTCGDPGASGAPKGPEITVNIQSRNLTRGSSGCTGPNCKVGEGGE